MLYTIRIQNRGSCDVVLRDVREEEVGDVVTSWCGGHTVVIVEIQDGSGECS